MYTVHVPRYVDDRVVAPWTDPAPWTALKPTMPWGQMPQLTYKGEKICQSMTICRFTLPSGYSLY